jgi:protein involved in polysaccharide export with SLBB domain
MPRHSFILLSLLAIISLVDLTSCHSSPSKRALQYMNQNGFGRRYSGESQEEDYVTTGDNVRVFDVNHPVDINFSVRVSSDGTVLLDQIGRVSIAGYTRSGLEAYLAERYSPYYTTPPSIVVDITTKGKVFFVLGEVTAEGSKPFQGNQTVLDVVLKAKPKQDTANIGRCLLIRGDPQNPLRLPFNLNDIIKGDTTTNYSIQEDDILWIPPTLFAEFGYFLRAALYPVTAVFQAIGGALLGAQGGRNNGVGNNRGLLNFGGVF